ncbi:hypothetical protein [Planctopirus hydrillae]|uniref:Uncharacterized protein n=1 Tax=Planctopirus hydrillae TaxID=1841610 RepID=A0A1C3EU11_9PLAN|nr:hypothetical protein [Planctopirus hydrillae]ODA36731.1 hypothetical protein A6X21_15420 [Planctopirus hydrillae]
MKSEQIDSQAEHVGLNFTFRRNRTYTKHQLLNEMGCSNSAIAAWIRAGLKPLNTGTKVKYFWGGDLFKIWRSEANMSRKRPERERANIVSRRNQKRNG